MNLIKSCSLSKRSISNCVTFSLLKYAGNQVFSKNFASRRYDGPNANMIKRSFSDAVNLSEDEKSGTVLSLNESQKMSFKNLEHEDTKSLRDIMNYLKEAGDNLNLNNNFVKEALKSSKKLRYDFLQKAKIEKHRNIMIDNLNSLLYFYDCCNDGDEIAATISLMKSNKFVNEAAYLILIRHKVRNEGWKSGLEIIQHMIVNGIEPHSRTYHSIILDAIEIGDFDDALSLYKDMKKLEIVFSDEFYSLLIRLLASNKSLSKDFLLEIFDLLKDTGFSLGPKSFLDAERWFLSGTCKNCSLKLKEFNLPKNVRLNLQDNIFQVAKHAISKSDKTTSGSSLDELLNISSRDTPSSKIHLLRQMVAISGPFDAVLDVLNIAYTGNKGFNSFQVKRVVKHYAEDGKKILALCSSPLMSSLLEKRAESSQQHMIQLLHFLRRSKCGISFVDDQKKSGHIDDYFVLLSVVFHNMNIDVITGDNFFDHVHSFDPVTKRHFTRWKRSHQVAVRNFTAKGKPIFNVREDYDIDIQNKKNSWHLPGPDGKWLCCTQKQTNKTLLTEH